MSSSVTLNDWRTIKLGEITTSYAGGTPLRTNPEYYSGGTVPWIKSGEVNKKYIFTCEERITEKAVKESSAKLFSSGSVLVAMYGATAGQTAICKIDASANQAVLAVNSKDKETTNEYIYYLLSFLAPIILLRSQGSGQPNLSKQILEEQELALPPLVEQKKIAEILTSVDRVIELTSMEIDKLKDLKKGMMQELLTKGIGHTKFKDSPVRKIPESWDVVRLGDCLAEKPSYGANASAVEFDSELPRYIRITDIDEDGNLILTAPKSITSEESKGYILENDDILIARTGNTVGKALMFKSRYGKCAYAGYLIRFKSNPNILTPRFLNQVLHSNLYYDWVKSITRVGAQPNINSQEYSDYLLTLPSVREQLEICKILESFDDNINLKNKLKQGHELQKKGLMNDLLTGKVRVKV